MTQETAPSEKNHRRYFLTGLAGFFLGFLVCLIWQTFWAFTPHFGFQWSTQKKVQQPEDPLTEIFKADPNGDPFQQMQKLRQQMLQQALQGDADESAGGEDQDSLHRPGIAPGVGEVTRREDEGFVYLDISIKGLDRQSLGVEVTDGQVNLKGQIHLKNEQNGSSGEVIESFNRSFPAPENTNTKKVEIENSQDILTLKFPKRG